MKNKNEVEVLEMPELGSIKIGENFDLKSLFNGKGKKEQREIASEVLTTLQTRIKALLFRNSQIDVKVKKAQDQINQLDPVIAVNKLKKERGINKKTAKILSEVYNGSLGMAEALSLLDKKTIEALSQER